MTNIEISEPVEVLYEYDGMPCLYTATLPTGPVLVYLSEDLKDERCFLFVVSDLSDVALRALKANLLTVRDALQIGFRCVVEMDYEHMRPVRSYVVSFETLSERLPAAGAMLGVTTDDR